MTWDQDDSLRDSILADIRAALPADMQPGDVTIQMVADSLGVSHSKAAYTLQKMEADGKLVSIRANVPGARTPMRVWRKPT